MKIIVLAAGKGERLLPLTQHTPKSLIDIGNGVTLLDEQVKRLRESGGIDEIVVIVGYRAEQVEAKVENLRSQGINIRTIFNPFYQVSNNLMTLWLASSEMKREDFMVTNGDNLFSSSVFSELASVAEDGIYLAIGAKNKFDFDDMRVSLKNERVSEVSKRILDHEAQAESPGLCLVRGQNAQTNFVNALHSLVRQPDLINAFWLEVFGHLYKKGTAAKPWWFDASHNWQEVDFHHDLSMLQTIILNKTAKLS